MTPTYAVTRPCAARADAQPTPPRARLLRVDAQPTPPRVRQRLLRAEEAAEYIGRTKKALYIMVQRDQIPVVRHGRSLRFDIEALDKWIEMHSY